METTVQTALTLVKEERIHGKTDISELLGSGKYGNIPGFRYCYRRENGKGFPRMMVSVPKKFFKRAVKRNLLKRRIRESWRKQKGMVPGNLDLLIMYNSKEIMDYETIYGAIGQIMRKVSDND